MKCVKCKQELRIDFEERCRDCGAEYVFSERSINPDTLIRDEKGKPYYQLGCYVLKK